MPLNKLPVSFFGVDYSAASGNISFGTASKSSGATAATVSAAPVSNVLITVDAHTLKPGDAVKFSGSAIGGITTGNTYYVKTTDLVSGVLKKLTLSETVGGAELALSGGGSGTTTVLALGSLNDLTDTEADPTAVGGDWRRVVAGVMDMFYRKWAGTPTTDRPSKISLNRSTVVDPVTGEVVHTYTCRVVNAPAVLEVADE